MAISTSLTNFTALISNRSKASSNHGVLIAYAVFITISMMVYHLVAEGEFSALLTLSAVFQCLAFSLLGIQMLSANSVKGISVKSLQLDAIALGCRLSATTWLNGYIPFDASGDYLYQTFDALSLAMVLGLLHRVTRKQRQVHDVDADTLSPSYFVVACFVLAAFLHGDLNDRPLFDTLWMCGLFVGTVAELPQLWMIAKSNSGVPALISHFIAVMALARGLSGIYMWHAYPEITCAPWIGNFQHAGYAVLAAHFLHMFLLGDFAVIYVKNVMKAGVQAPLTLDDAWLV